jgi:hypothetical protein
VVALELTAPGAERWRARTAADLSQVFKPAPDVLAVADATGRVQLLDPATGKTQATLNVYPCEEGVTDGALIDDVLYVCGYEKREAVYDKRRWVLAAVQAPSGKILWNRKGIEARPYLSADMLRASSNAIPLAILTPAGGDERQARAGRLSLTLLDKRTGQPIGETVTADVPNTSKAHAILDVQVRPGQIIVMAGSSRIRVPVGNEVRSEK